ncbi:MAG: hypothetical protein KGO96_06090 [Elusimicrobia bacterium]|nr:hypothetical protein [Elusimicrobiota bacterium]MDE2425459.1 hypothetical protein [Elusimicrobiota bacterium]
MVAERPYDQRDIGDCHAFAAIELLESALKREGHPLHLSAADLFIMGTVMRPDFRAELLKEFTTANEGFTQETQDFDFPEGGTNWFDLKYALRYGVARREVVGDAEVFGNYNYFRNDLADALNTWMKAIVHKRLRQPLPGDERYLDAVIERLYYQFARSDAGSVAVVKSLHIPGLSTDRQILGALKGPLLKPLFNVYLVEKLSYEVLARKFTLQESMSRLNQLFGSGRIAAIERSRLQVLRQFKGFSIAIPPLPLDQLGQIKTDVLAQDQKHGDWRRREEDWVVRQLCVYRRPVGIGINLDALPNWEDSGGHDFVLTGIRSFDRQGRPTAFAVRNDVGQLAQQHDVPADSLQFAAELCAVAAPADHPRRR